MIFRKNDSNGFRTSAVIETMPWRKAGEPLHTARAELCYDEAAFYVRMRAYEIDRLAGRTQFGDPVCRDSCLEFFFAPIPGDNAYFNFELNPLATMYVGFSPAGTRESSRLLSDPDIRDNSFFSAKASSCGAYWEVSYRIPYCFIRRYAPGVKTPEPGDVLRCNF